MMQDLWMKKRNFKKQVRFANVDEKEGLLKIWQDLKKKKKKKKNTMLLARQKICGKRRVKRWKEQERFFFSGTIQICKEHIWSTEIRRAQDGENSSGETFNRHTVYSQ